MAGFKVKEEGWKGQIEEIEAENASLTRQLAQTRSELQILQEKHGNVHQNLKKQVEEIVRCKKEEYQCL
jgi:chromosome segregation ATPase